MRSTSLFLESKGLKKSEYLLPELNDTGSTIGCICSIYPAGINGKVPAVIWKRQWRGILWKPTHTQAQWKLCNVLHSWQIVIQPQLQYFQWGTAKISGSSCSSFKENELVQVWSKATSGHTAWPERGRLQFPETWGEKPTTFPKFLAWLRPS